MGEEEVGPPTEGILLVLQEAGDVEVALGSGGNQGVLATQQLSSDIIPRTGGAQNLAALEVSEPGSHEEGSTTISVLCIHMSSILNKQGDNIIVPHLAGMHE